MNLEQLARATAAVLWADERDTLEEWAAAERIFTDNGVDWEKAKPVIEEELEALIDESDVESKEDSEEDLSFGVIDFGPGIDPYDILCGLAQLACSDKELTWQEIDIMHRLGESMNVGKELVTTALVGAAATTGVTVALD